MSQPLRQSETVQPVAPPPEDMPLVETVLAILAAKYALDQTVRLVAAALAPYGIGVEAVRAALGLARTAHAPRPELKRHGFHRASAAADVARRTAAADAGYRAAYVVNAARRLQASLNGGTSMKDALRQEAANFEAHRRARQKRLDAAAATSSAAALYGGLLGWYRNPLLDSDIDCRVADGNNFDASEGTIIGWPGAVHPNCGCHAGPPHEDGEMVNDVLGSVLGRMTPSAAQREVLRLKPRRRAG